jgi:hypothetical protein
VQFADLRTRFDRHAELMSLEGRAANTAIHFFLQLSGLSIPVRGASRFLMYSELQRRIN